MGIADLTSRLTLLLSVFGQALVLINLPLILWTDYRISWASILLLVFAPVLSALLQLALSRSREYDADLGAAGLLGNPGALASALAKMERYQGGFIERVLFPNHRRQEPSLLRTHPPTEKRIRRLLEVSPHRPQSGWPPLQLPSHVASWVVPELPEARRRSGPRRWF